MYHYLYDPNTGDIKGVAQGTLEVGQDDCAVFSTKQLVDPNTHDIDLATMQFVSNGQSPMQPNTRR